jgi:amino acid permease
MYVNCTGVKSNKTTPKKLQYKFHLYLYVSVYHFPLCYLIICFSVGIYRQNTTITISGVLELFV